MATRFRALTIRMIYIVCTRWEIFSAVDMSAENLAQLKKFLDDEDYKELLEFCCEPRAWKEISKLKIKQSKMFKMLKDLKTSETLLFADGKYYTAPHAKEYMT